MFAEKLLLASGVYLLGGFLFAVPFVVWGIGRIDPAAARSGWGFRVIVIPGVLFLWPLLAVRWGRGVSEPPEERNAHRCAARKGRTA